MSTVHEMSPLEIEAEAGRSLPWAAFFLLPPLLGSALVLGAEPTVWRTLVLAALFACAAGVLLAEVARPRLGLLSRGLPLPAALMLSLAGWCFLQSLPVPRGWIQALSSGPIDALRLSTGDHVTSGLEPDSARLEALRWLAMAVLASVAAAVGREGSWRRATLRILGLWGGVLAVPTLLGWGPTSLEGAGWFANPNHNAGALVMLLPISVGASLSSRQSRTSRGLLILSAVLQSGALLMTRSVGAWVALGCAVVWVMAIVVGRRHDRTRSALVLASVALAVLLGLLVTGEGPLAQKLAFRWSVWREVSAVAGDHLVLGTGAGAFDSVFPVYQQRASELSFGHPESDWVLMVIELGAPGVILVSVLVLAFGARLVRRLSVGRRSAWSGAIAAVALLLHGAVDINLHVPANALAFAWIIGLTWGSLARRREQTDVLEGTGDGGSRIHRLAPV